MEGKFCAVENNTVKVISSNGDGFEDLFDPLGEIETWNENMDDNPPVPEEVLPEIEKLPPVVPQEEPVQPPAPPPVRRSARHSTPPKRLTYEHADTDDDEDVAAMFSGEMDQGEISYVDATTGNDSEKWLSSMRK